MADAVEKVLNSLIDSMHKHIAKGNGEKKIDTKKEITAAVDKADIPEEKVDTVFEAFLKMGKDKPKSNRVEITLGKASTAPKKKAKK